MYNIGNIVVYTKRQKKNLNDIKYFYSLSLLPLICLFYDEYNQDLNSHRADTLTKIT